MDHVVIVGGGFGGLWAARELALLPVTVTLIDRSNHHLFQPLLYQVAMAGLSPAEIAVPIRSLVSEHKNISVILSEVTSIDLDAQQVHVREPEGRSFHYDRLIIAAGARTSWFGHDEWAQHALGLKDLDDAVEIRRRVLVSFEAAERESDPALKKKLLTFVVIGGGPTGVEVAGALAELSRYVLNTDFRSIDSASARVVLLEAGPTILSTFDPDLSAKARTMLEDLGVEVKTGAKVTCIDERGVEMGHERIDASVTVWGAGVRAASIAESMNVPLDRGGRVIVEEDCSIPGHKNAFAIGDVASFLDDNKKPLPGVSPVAMQQARFVAKTIERDLSGRPREKFKYFDKGSMATIGRSRAIAQVGKLKISGFEAWMVWLVVHVFYLIGFKNRLFVLFSWAWSYFTYKRGARLITGRILSPFSRTRRSTTEETLPAANLPPPSSDHRTGASRS